MIKYIFYILLYLSNIYILQAQNKIEGIYKPNKQIFETEDKTYWIDFFNNGIARISKDGYFGLVDSTGTIVCKPQYDKIFDFEGGVARVGLNGKFGLVNHKGEEIMKPFAHKISPFEYGMAVYQENYHEKLYGLIKEDGSFLGKADYQALSFRKEGYFLFSKEGKVGIINKKGEEVWIENLNSNTSKLSLKGGDIYLFEKSKYNRIIRPTSSLSNTFRFLKKYEIPIIFEFPRPSHKPQPFKFLTYQEGLTPFVGKNYQVGFMNEDFQIIVPPKYDYVSNYKNGYAIVALDNKLGVIDKAGNMVIPLGFSSARSISPTTKGDKFIIVSDKGSTVVDIHNRVLFQSPYYIYYLFDGLFATLNKDFKYGVVDSQGKIVLPHKYNGILKFDKNKGVAYQNKGSHPASPIRALAPQYETTEYIYFNNKGSLKDIDIYTGIGDRDRGILYLDYNHDVFVQAEEKSKEYGLVEELKGGYKIIADIVSPKPDTSTFSLLGTYLPIARAYNFQIINHKKELVVPSNTLFTLIYNKGLNTFVVNRNGRYGVVDLQNEAIIPIEDEYRHIDIFSGVIVVTKVVIPYQLSGVIVFDLTGKTLIPFKENISYEEGNAGALIMKDKSGTYMIDKKGNKIKKY